MAESKVVTKQPGSIGSTDETGKIKYDNKIKSENECKTKCVSNKTNINSEVTNMSDVVLESESNEFLDSKSEAINKASNNQTVEMGTAESLPEINKINVNKNMKDRIKAIIYGNCIGDAIGLLTEFLPKSACNKYYEKNMKNDKGLQYRHKIPDLHRSRWIVGDWTDDSDQMILILQMLIEKGKVDYIDYGRKLKNWSKFGFPDIGDKGGFGIGRTTHNVLTNKEYENDPHIAASYVWEKSGKKIAPNGGVMRTSALGIYEFNNLDNVFHNTLSICKVSHADPRCQASCLAVTIAIAKMLQKSNDVKFKKFENKDIETIIDETKIYIKQKFFDSFYENDEDSNTAYDEFNKYINKSKLSDLHLEEQSSIGYTYKCMAAGFWALRKVDFRKALTKLVLEGGDADTNGAVAGALLGARLGLEGIDRKWLEELASTPKNFLDGIMNKFIDKFFEFK